MTAVSSRADPVWQQHKGKVMKHSMFSGTACGPPTASMESTATAHHSAAHAVATITTGNADIEGASLG